MPTMKDVAREAGVSVTTVSATLNKTAPVSAETRRRVEAAIRRVGYQPNPIARHLRSGQSTTVGLVIPDISLAYFAHLAKNIHRALSEHGFRLYLSSNDGDPDTEIEDIRSFVNDRVAGLMIAPTSLDSGIGERLREAITVPAVTVDRFVPELDLDVVADDNHYGASLVTHYLLRLGHRDIAFIAGRIGISVSDERLEGFLQTMKRTGVPVRDDLIATGDHTFDLAFRTIQRFMTADNPPTAIASINAAQTRGIMMALKSLNLKVPDDVSVISFDGFHGSEGWVPAITSLHQDVAGISREAAAILIRRIANGNASEPKSVVRLPPTLVVGESCRQVGEALT